MDFTKHDLLNYVADISDCEEPPITERSSMDITFYYDARRAGGGKTYDIVTVACERAARGDKCLIVQPTTRLIDETCQQAQDRFPNVTTKKFHSEDGTDGNVYARIMGYFSNADLGGAVVFLTHKSLLDLPYMYRPDRWSLYLDECLSAFENFSDQLPDYHSIITDHVGLADLSSVYARLTVINKPALEKTARNENKDTIVGSVRDLARILLSTRYDSYVNLEKFSALRSSKSVDGNISVFSLFKPTFLSEFKRVTIAAARFEETFTYHWWSRCGVNWKKSSELAPDGVTQVHPFNPSVTIHYGYKTRYSKHMRNQLGREATPIIDAAKKLLGKQSYVRVENNDVKLLSPLMRLSGDHLIPGISHGLNCYQGIHHAAVIIANNQTPQAAKFLTEFCGFDADRQFTAFTNHSVYQAICRTSIRTNESSRNMTWIVASKETADWLNLVFPGSRVQALGLIQPKKKRPGRTRTSKSDNERKNKSRNNLKAELSLAGDFAHQLHESICNDIIPLDKCDDLAIKDISHFVAKFRASIFNNYYDTSPRAICRTEARFISYLKKHHMNRYIAKNEIPCVSGAMFASNGDSSSSRGTDNVKFVRGMWLDIENGTMTHEEFADAFPHIQFAAYNTFSHTREKPRYRIYIPTNRVMTDVEYRSLFNEIVYVLESKGFRRGNRYAEGCSVGPLSKYHGIDHRPQPCAVFALPCQAQARADSFFKEYKSDNRHPLDVNAWMLNSIAPDYSNGFNPSAYMPIEGDDDTITIEQRAGIDACMAEWYRVGVMPGEGDAEIFALFQSLRALRVNPLVMSECLIKAARSASSPNDRDKQVKRLMRKLTRM
ncbi:hypothetical protein [Methylorubrum extorquens]|uniref:hypothetical protein n=1 Tax=Methylorubrum extorquens TaxID=408 RepID=UPI0012DB6043|nr:hypothetical protein [Methylorubrum extorquens]